MFKALFESFVSLLVSHKFLKSACDLFGTEIRDRVNMPQNEMANGTRQQERRKSVPLFVNFQKAAPGGEGRTRFHLVGYTTNVIILAQLNVVSNLISENVRNSLFPL